MIMTLHVRCEIVRSICRPKLGAKIFPNNSIFISFIHITMKYINNMQDSEKISKMYNKETMKK